jgi:hypothetical protein
MRATAYRPTMTRSPIARSCGYGSLALGPASSLGGVPWLPVVGRRVVALAVASFVGAATSADGEVARSGVAAVRWAG